VPNAAHQALARLEEALGDRFLLVTQNIDNLHERAGNRRVIHMHGELLKVRCSWSGQVLAWTGDVTTEDKCHCCQFPAPLRPHVVWFGEMPLDMDEIYLRWPSAISLSPSALPGTFIRRQALFTKRGCRAPIR
jgi:NAD-dependent deacetylase